MHVDGVPLIRPVQAFCINPSLACYWFCTFSCPGMCPRIQAVMTKVARTRTLLIYHIREYIYIYISYLNQPLLFALGYLRNVECPSMLRRTSAATNSSNQQRNQESQIFSRSAHPAGTAGTAGTANSTWGEAGAEVKETCFWCFCTFGDSPDNNSIDPHRRLKQRACRIVQKRSQTWPELWSVLSCTAVVAVISWQVCHFRLNGLAHHGLQDPSSFLIGCQGSNSVVDSQDIYSWWNP